MASVPSEDAVLADDPREKKLVGAGGLGGESVEGVGAKEAPKSWDVLLAPFVVEDVGVAGVDAAGG